METGVWFKSTLFEIQPNEDEETNPGRYGKSLAFWLSSEFSKLGYSTEVIPEDWGWCVMCYAGDYYLWLGCGSMQSEEGLEAYDKNNPPNGRDIVWHVFPHIEVPFFKLKSLINQWRGKLNLNEPLLKLESELNEVLASQSSIELCEEP